ncbi:hypothetical protein [Methylovulum miyakonense]|uniref:hypothetical protein n=1 Tax=Methylovulum miyakonense TaxID=645578 RepID=UPI00035CA215|nr:hypothetical protein [Methylovulum miyakonense]
MDVPPVGGFKVRFLIKVRWLHLGLVSGAPLTVTLGVCNIKTVMVENDIRRLVFSLNGYLSAMRDMNDMHSGTRYWFSADMIYLEEQSVESAIREYCKKNSVSIKPIDLDEELAIIESYILDNYLFGNTNPNNEAHNYIKNLHGWRVQEYISLAANYEKENEHWVVESDDGKSKSSYVFVKIKNYLVVMIFLREKNNYTTQRSKGRAT